MHVKAPESQLLYPLLRIATVLLFAGRAWQHLFWDAPFRALFWDQQIMEGLVLFLRGGTWQEYATSENMDVFIRWVTKGVGIFYLLMAVLTVFVTGRTKKVAWLYVLSSVFLAFLAFLYSKEKFYHIGQFLEYAIQFLLPVVFLYSIKGRLEIPKLPLLLKIAIALTFSAHGLYAIGFYPQPGVFVDMVINIFHISEAHAKLFLKIAGVLDFLVAVLVFIPRISKYALFYAVLWGGLTALARTWANFYWSFPLESLHQHLYETIYRTPHMLVPLAALLITAPGFGRLKKRR